MIYIWVGIKLGTARIVGQCFTQWATGAPISVMNIQKSPDWYKFFHIKNGIFSINIQQQIWVKANKFCVLLENMGKIKCNIQVLFSCRVLEK